MFPTAADLGYVELRGGGSRLVVIPALGGKISEMELAGRQWLWTSDVIPYAMAGTRTSYVETADTGGYDECFPTVGRCRIPGWVRAYGGIELPDHGELWSQEPTLEIETSVHGQCAVTSWQGLRLPYRLTRVARVSPTGDAVLDYHVANDGDERMPFIWSSHPLLPLTPDTELLLPDGAPMRVYATHRIALGDHQSIHRWPFVRAAGKAIDFRRPFDVAKQYACKLFVDVPDGRAHAILRQAGAELVVEFDATAVGQFGLWVNKHGWTPFRNEAPYLNLAFEPCIGAPDTLSDALGDWKRAHWLEPDEVRSWSLTWRGRRVE
ncbi:MAG: hypothetical protein MNPFHGCM_02385 [Gemmatimonadaceae bacterium]|nr:hypothetical protein [Gemmatimonadaceae bacterium]